MGVSIENMRFRYPTERFELAIKRMEIEPSCATAIIGHSGCGKTTLLRLVAGILRPSAGRIRVLDAEIESMSEPRRRSFRIRHLGLVFQEFELLDYLTAAENILLPFRVSRSLTLGRDARELMHDLAEQTGIRGLLDSYPRRLSQGERQRVAICRALVTRPSVVLADEPTGSLDPETQDRIVRLLKSTAGAAGAGLIMVTHDHELLGHFDRVIDLPELAAAAR